MSRRLNPRLALPLGVLAVSALTAVAIVLFVGPSPAPAVRPVAGCSPDPASGYPCYRERFQSLVQTAGVPVAMQTLRSESQAKDLVKFRCHEFAHEIGRAAARRYHSVARTYSRGDDFCSAGYYHGAMEAFVAELGARRVLAKAGTLCAALKRRSYSHYTCAHGLGHGFMLILGERVFKALGTCDALPDKWESDGCYGGVFMQNLMAHGDPSRPSKSKYLKADRPLYPCTEVGTRYKYRCYQMQIQYALKTVRDDFAKGFDICAKADRRYRNVCYQGLGNYVSVQNTREHVTDAGRIGATHGTCLLGADRAARTGCIEGAAKAFVMYYQRDREAKAFCAAFTEKDLHGACLRNEKRALDYKSGRR